MFNFLNDYDLYVTLVAVAESPTLAEAARKLHVSQATVSLRLKALQARYGFPILEKRGRRVVVLEAGLKLKDAVKDSLGGLQARLSSLELGGGHAAVRPIRIGARQEVFLKLDTAFKVKAPVHFLSMTSHQARAALLKSEIDVAVSHVQPESLEFIAQPLFLDSFVLCVPKKLAQAAGIYWPPRSAKDYRAIFDRLPALSYGPESKLFSDFARAHGFDGSSLRPAVIYEDWGVLRNFLRNASGFGLFPQTFTRGLGADVLKQDVPSRVMKPLQFYYLYKKEFRGNSQLRELGAALANALG